jgi:hypothetical protein
MGGEEGRRERGREAERRGRDASTRASVSCQCLGSLSSVHCTLHCCLLELSDLCV